MLYFGKYVRSSRVGGSTIKKRLRVTICIALLSAWLSAAQTSIVAQADSSGPLRVIAQAGGVRLESHNPSNTGPELARGTPGQPLVEVGGLRLPATLVALRVPDQSALALRIERLSSVPWRGQLSIAEAPTRQTSAGEPRPALAAPPEPAVPASPLVVLRDARMRGARIAVVAFSPIFTRNGVLRAVTELEATIPDAALLGQDVTGLLSHNTPFLAAAPAPTNPAATGVAWTIHVTSAGIQRLPAAALAAAGVDLSARARLHLYRGGQEVALEERSGADGLELRFYAPAPGDRWNAADLYWLTIEQGGGRRMSIRSAMPGAAAARSTAVERGSWRDNKLYDSTLPGLDGDHWYAADLKTGPRQVPAILSVPLTPTLPLVAGTSTLTVTGAAYTSGQHNLAVTLGATTQTATWSGSGGWARTFALGENSASAVVTLTPGAGPDGVELDSLAWQRPVALAFGGRGAAFEGVAGTWQYQLSGTAAERTLYDVSDPRAPSILTLPNGTTTAFEDGPAARQYILTGPGALFTPRIAAHQPIDVATAGDVVYIAPAAFHAALAPLVARRQGQGHTVRVVDVQAIYDAWSFGQISPAAIRDFLRYAAATWSTAPIAVLLVGDGTSDPLNYTGRNNTNFIPPYLAMVDPWIGETACEACYARLDGADPLADALPDLAIGRLPVKSAAELAALVSKIVGYETSALNPSWRSRNLYVADNYRDANNTPDGAGDFAAFADSSVAEQPSGVEVRRVYYDPSPSSAGVPWREPDALRAYQRTLAALNEGAGLVNYVGHSHTWQWAVTDPSISTSYLLGLYDPDALTNGDRTPIVLEMTCLTSAFQTPAFSGTTIDERLLLKPNGGAVAVWGPTGLGVAHGHDALQRGFYRALWGAPPLSASLGTLVTAGYLELFSNGGCCQDTLATYVLLGDPLTPARVLAAKRVYLPIGRR